MAVARLRNLLRLEEEERSLENGSCDAELRSLVVHLYQRLQKVFGLTMKCIELALIYFERVCSQIARKHIPKLVVVCLFLAIKFCESRMVKLKDLCDHSNVPDGDLEVVCRLEVVVLQMLEWKLFVPSTTEYISVFFESIGQDAKSASQLRSLCELAVTRNWTRRFRPSQLAAAIMVVGFNDLDMLSFRKLLNDVKVDTHALEDAVDFVMLGLGTQRSRVGEKRGLDSESEETTQDNWKRARAEVEDDEILMSTSPCSSYDEAEDGV